MAPPRSLYVHVPFCERKCFYCAFNSTPDYTHRHLDFFLDAAEAELRALNAGERLELDTIYVGGGTPTALDTDRLDRLLGAIKGRLAPGCSPAEWTVEMNPGTADAAKLGAMTRNGVTRVSMGVQSMQPERLRRMGRIHGPQDVVTAVELIRAAGIKRFNLDLIYGQPDQTLDEWLSDVDALLALTPTHLSMYCLIFEESTPYGKAHARGIMEGAAEDLAVNMFEAGRIRLADAGLDWYEVSNFAKAGEESLHNMVYWDNQPYYGVGPGAYSCDGHSRMTNEADLLAWHAGVTKTGTAHAEVEPLSPRDTYVETFTTGLRTRRGVNLAAVKSVTGIDPMSLHGEYIESLGVQQLVTIEWPYLKPTLKGVLLLDSLVLGFM